jgi:hypothetical protein
MSDKRTYTCPNKGCQKTFEKPLKALNLHLDPEKPYDACPYCFTKIEEKEIFANNKSKQIVTEINSRKHSSETKGKPPSCQFHIGYLSEREQKQKIPENCIVCRYIVDCMLKKMRSE